ncbi:asparaginase, partial [Streptomyces sp. NPDC059981]
FEGVQVAALPDGRAVAVKVADGADRARTAVTAAALARAGVEPRLLAGFTGEPVTGGGRTVGGIRPVAALNPPGAPVTATA